MLVVIMRTNIFWYIHVKNIHTNIFREAARQGADLIECDMALTKDHALVCSHAPYLRSVFNWNLIKIINEFHQILICHHLPKRGHPNHHHDLAVIFAIVGKPFATKSDVFLQFVEFGRDRRLDTF